MLYKGENPILQISGVARMNWGSATVQVAPRNYSALAFRLSGSAILTCGRKEYYVNQGDILYLPQGLGYSAQYTDTELVVIHFVTARDDPAPQIYTVPGSERIRTLFLQTQSIWVNKEPGYRMRVISTLYAILAAVEEAETVQEQPPHFLRALSYIHAHYRNSGLSVAAVCTEAGISETVFRRLFKKYYQKSPIAYITDLRLEYAIPLIAAGEPIESAAEQSGFNDPKYFARVVKKRFGCPPRFFKSM